MSTSLTRAQNLLWDWSYTSGEGSTFFAGSGTFTTTSTATNGYYTITGITGTWEDLPGNNAGPIYTITGLIPPGGDGALGIGPNDNLLSASYPQLTYYMGVAFTDSSDSTDAILSSSQNSAFPNYRAYSDTPKGDISDDNTGTFTATEVGSIPEPSTWAMMLGGMAALFFFARRQLNA
jgi:hypothetical protein